MNNPQNTAPSWSKLLDLLSANWATQRWRDVGVVIGCSGGADSVALLRLMSELRKQGDKPPRGFVIAAHFNHGLRGHESDDDQKFVEQLSDGLGLRFETACAQTTETSEAALRSMRMQFLTDTALATGARYIAVAHSADDNAETVIHHLLRGTGPAGLTGISHARSLDSDLVLLRPLLKASRSDIRKALNEVAQTWREDSSNQQLHYQRNWIRHELLPTIEHRYPHAVDAINRAVSGQREWRNLVDQLAQTWLDQHQVEIRSTESKPDEVSLRRDHSTDRVVVISAMQQLWTEMNWSRGAMARDHWCRLANTINSQTLERYSLPGPIDVDATKPLITLSDLNPGPI
jgi:tRNA(Ile)-lysidine synthase